jgi:hypothetical protein
LAAIGALGVTTRQRTAVRKDEVMDMEHPYEDEADRQRHRRAIESTAQELDCSVDEVEEFYEEVLKGMASKARIRDYLPILVAKSVKRSLRGRPRSG